MDQCCNPECKELRKELERLKSTGYDMLKQGGKWQSSGATHDDLKQQFMEFFDHDVYDIVDGHFQGSEDNSAREILSNAFQDIFENCRKHILNEMLKALQRVVHLEDSRSSGVENEALYDAIRAYGLLLHVTGLSKSKEIPEEYLQECCHNLSEKVPHLGPSEINDFTDKAAALSWELLTTVPPMVSAQPKCKFDKKWHEVDSDSWDNSCSKYELVYYRPVLFQSSAGTVAREGLVGNRKHPELLHQCVRDEPRLPKHDYRTHTRSPLQVPSTPAWPSCGSVYYRSSQAQTHDHAYQREAKRRSTGNELSTHNHLPHQQPTQRALRLSTSSYSGAIAREMGNRKHPALLNQTECVRDQPRLKRDYHQTHTSKPPAVPSTSSWSSCGSIYNRSSQAHTQFPAVNESRRHDLVWQPANWTNTNVLAEWNRKSTPMYTTDQRIREDYYQKLFPRSPNPAQCPPSHGMPMKAYKPAAAHPFNRQHTPDKFKLTPDDHAIFFTQSTAL